MTVTLVFLAVVAAIVGWWLSRQRLGSKPWLEEGVIGDVPVPGAWSFPTAKIGLGVFLAVVGSLFALAISAYSMRMEMADWRPLPVPNLLWVNTAALALGSVALQFARGAARRGELAELRSDLLAGGASALAFLAGQLMAWQQLADAGYYLATNPANAFFYMLTALHGLHLVGGIVALGWVTARVWRGDQIERLRVNIDLCAVYWHFMLFVWLVLLVVLAGWAGDFIEMCRQLVS